MADGVGFEPTVPVKVRRFSRPNLALLSSSAGYSYWGKSRSYGAVLYLPMRHGSCPSVPKLSQRHFFGLGIFDAYA